MDRIRIKFTWRIYFFAVYVSIVSMYSINAILNYYSNKYFAVLLTFLLLMSYMFAVFLINVKE